MREQKRGDLLRQPTGYLLAVLLVLLAGVLYWRTVGFPFITLDDPDYVTENPVVQQGLTTTGIRWAFTTFHASNWHPLSWMSHMLDCELFGLDPRGHHAISVLLHAGTSLLLFFGFAIMTRRLGPSAFVAFTFLVHPLHAESVAWVSERKDVLCGFFFTVGLYAYVRYVRSRSVMSYLAVCAALVAGLMAKPMLVTFPFVLLLLDYWPLQRLQLAGTLAPQPAAQEAIPVSRLLIEKAPLLLVSFCSCLVTYLAQQKGGAVSSLLALPFEDRIGNALVSCLSYIQKTFIPVDLAIFYPYSQASLWKVACSLLVLVGVTGIALILRKRFPAFLIGWLWYLGILVPVIGLVQVGAQAMADRYMYLPLIGLAIAVGFGSQQICERTKISGAVLTAVGVLAISALSTVAYRNLTYWSSEEALFSKALRSTSRNFLAYGALGTAKLNGGDLVQASECFRKALEIKSGHLPALFGLAKVLETEGNLDEAERLLQKAVSLSPNSASAHYNLAAVLGSKRSFPAAREHYLVALELDPDHARSHNNLAQILLMEGKIDEGIRHAARAAQLLPNSPEAHYNLGNGLFLKKEFSAAADHYRAALRENRQFSAARLSLAKVLISSGEFSQAERELLSLLEAEPSNMEAHQVLVGIQLQSGLTEKGLSAYKEVVERGNQPPEVLNNLAWLLATDKNPRIRDGQQAVRLAQKACDLTQGTNSAMLSTLAAAFAESGKFSRAIETQEIVLESARKDGNQMAISGAQKRLELYRSGKTLQGSSF